MFCSYPHGYIHFLPLQIPSYLCFFSSSLSFSVLPIHLFSSPFLIFLVLQVCWMCPLKGAVRTQQSLQFLKSNRTCSWGWISLGSKCPRFALGVQGAHDWVHYKLVIMSLMSQMPWDCSRSQDWACLCRERNALLPCTAIGLLLCIGHAEREPGRAARSKLHSKCQERNGTLAPHGRTGQREAEWMN